jgi:prevent-host-death family protein
MQVNILEAKNRLSELIRAVQAGEEVVISNRGKPVARLVAEGEGKPKHKPYTGAAILDWLAKNPLPENLRRTPEEIDRDIAELRSDWPE